MKWLQHCSAVSQKTWQLIFKFALQPAAIQRRRDGPPGRWGLRSCGTTHQVEPQRLHRGLQVPHLLLWSPAHVFSHRRHGSCPSQSSKAKTLFCGGRGGAWLVIRFKMSTLHPKHSCPQKDFMSLELSEGKVKVNFDLGSGVGSAVSATRHNDGRWKSLTVSRNKKQGRVDGEVAKSFLFYVIFKKIKIK